MIVLTYFSNLCVGITIDWNTIWRDRKKLAINSALTAFTFNCKTIPITFLAVDRCKQNPREVCPGVSDAVAHLRIDTSTAIDCVTASMATNSQDRTLQIIMKVVEKLLAGLELHYPSSNETSPIWASPVDGNIIC